MVDNIVEMGNNIKSKKISDYMLVIWFGYVGMNSPERDYQIHGSTRSKIFNCIGAAANLCFLCNTGILPEIQVC